MAITRSTRRAFWPASVVSLAAVVFLLAGFRQPADPAVAPAPSDEPAAETFTLELWPLDAAATRGRVVYEQYCIGCHGPEGLGNGEAARWLDPRPRNFQMGRFKFRSTPSGELPLLEDIVHVVTCGLNGSAMRSFPLLPESARRDVAAYVLSLAEFGMVRREVESLLEDDMTLQEVMEEEYDELLADVHEAAWEEVYQLSVQRRGAMDADSIERGRVLYESQCVACHGATGVGDGSSSYHLRDWKDAPIRPRDFTTGVFRAGSSPRDVFMRLKSGLNGTPMPSVYGSDEDLWDLTHYILSLVDVGKARVVHPTSCDAHGDGR